MASTTPSDPATHADSTRAVTVREGSSLKVSGAQTEGMERSNALVGVSEQVCASLMVAHPHSGSAVHHHGGQDTVVYCVSGHGGFVESDGGASKQPIGPGDWALIPAGKEHREVNDGDGDVTWVIVRAPGGTPEVINLDGWGGRVVQG